MYLKYISKNVFGNSLFIYLVSHSWLKYGLCVFIFIYLCVCVVSWLFYEQSCLCFLAEGVSLPLIFITQQTVVLSVYHLPVSRLSGSYFEGFYVKMCVQRPDGLPEQMNKCPVRLFPSSSLRTRSQVELSVGLRSAPQVLLRCW